MWMLLSVPIWEPPDFSSAGPLAPPAAAAWTTPPWTKRRPTDDDPRSPAARSVQASDWRQNPQRWFVRGSLGFGAPAASDQRELLQLSGYTKDGLRYHYLLDGGGFPWPHVGLGGFAGYSSRRVEAENGGPPLEEDVYAAGLEIPLTAGNEKFRLLFVPRFGFVSGQQSLHGSGEFVDGPLFGADLGFVFPKVHIGFLVGGYSAPVPPSGELGESENFGGGFIAFSVYFDG
jgi:hypothetical protein